MSDPYRLGTAGACPRCQSALARLDRGGIDVDECAACGGGFLVPPTVERLVASPELRAAVEAELAPRARYLEHEVRYLRCPRCLRPMNRRVFARVSGVVVDVCKEDGVFFDGGELSAVLGFLAAGGLARQAAFEERERASLVKESRRPSSVAVILPSSGADPSSSAELLHMLVELFR